MRYQDSTFGQHPRTPSTGGGALGCISFLLLAVVILGYIGFRYDLAHSAGNNGTVTFTVQSRDDQPTGQSGHQYLIFATSGQVYKDTDNWFIPKTNSSDVYAMLVPGRTVTCHVNGKRNHATSAYPNLISCVITGFRPGH